MSHLMCCCCCRCCCLQITPHQEQLWSVQRIERQHAAEVKQKLEAELKEAVAQKVATCMQA